MFKNKPTMLITIDVEDWFQVENFKQYIPYSTWSNRQLRVEKNIHRLLDLFDIASSRFTVQGSRFMNRDSRFRVHGSRLEEQGSEARGQRPEVRGRRSEVRGQRAEVRGQGLDQDTINSEQSGTANGQQTADHLQDKKVRCTFFVLGWLAERLPGLVREIQSRGHEIASHGYSHNLCYDCGYDELRRDLSDSRKMLEDILGAPVSGYRAPSFSIKNNILKIIEECGYLYDSSYNSFGLHGRYGRLDLTDYSRNGIVRKISDTFYELPISNLQIKNPFKPVLSFTGYKQGNALNPGSTSNTRNSTNLNGLILPWGGGGYFRLIPFSIFKKGVASILRHDNAYVFYMHPWEIDPEQPRVNEAPMSFRFRHYCNLKGCRSKVLRLIETYSECTFSTCDQYIKDSQGEFKMH